MVLSELHGAVDAPELIEIGSDSYLGAHVTLRPLKVEGSSVKAVGVSIGDGCFVGPNTLLQPGSMIKGATGANSIISSHEIVPDGRVCHRRFPKALYTSVAPARSTRRRSGAGLSRHH